MSKGRLVPTVSIYKRSKSLVPSDFAVSLPLTLTISFECLAHCRSHHSSANGVSPFDSCAFSVHLLPCSPAQQTLSVITALLALSAGAREMRTVRIAAGDGIRMGQEVPSLGYKPARTLQEGRRNVAQDDCPLADADRSRSEIRGNGGLGTYANFSQVSNAEGRRSQVSGSPTRYTAFCTGGLSGCHANDDVRRERICDARGLAVSTQSRLYHQRTLTLYVVHSDSGPLSYSQCALLR